MIRTTRLTLISSYVLGLVNKAMVEIQTQGVVPWPELEDGEFWLIYTLRS